MVLVTALCDHSVDDDGRFQVCKIGGCEPSHDHSIRCADIIGDIGVDAIIGILTPHEGSRTDTNYLVVRIAQRSTPVELGKTRRGQVGAGRKLFRNSRLNGNHGINKIHCREGVNRILGRCIG